MKPMVSVIIPTYNRPAPLRDALTSVALQRDVPGEVEAVVVNDGGRGVDVVPDAAREGGLAVRLISLDHNRGLPAARNVGMREARGDYLAFLDDDDILLPDHLRVGLNALGSGEADLAYTICIMQESRVDPANPPTFTASPSLPFDAELMSVANFMPVHSAVLRRPPDSARFDETLPVIEDWDMWLRLLRDHRYRFVHVPQPTVVYHRITSEASMVGAAVSNGRALAEFATLTEKMWKRWPALTAKADHFRLYVDMIYGRCLARLASDRPIGKQYFHRSVEEIGAVWHGNRPEAELRQRIIESIEEGVDASSNT